MFFDPENLALPDDTEAGLVRIGGAQLHGAPVLPGTYAPGIAYRDQYSVPKSFFSAKWADMVAAGTIKGASLFAEMGRDVPPYFAYNGLLENPAYTREDFYKHPRRNGSLFLKKSPGLRNRYSLCASLYAPIGLDLDGPHPETMHESVRHYLEQKFYNDKGDTRHQPARRVNTGDIWAAGEWKAAFLDDLKRAFGDREVLWVEQVGTQPSKTGDRIYLLYKLAGPNGFFTYFRAAIQKVDAAQCSLRVYELDHHLVSEMQVEMHAERCKRFYDVSPYAGLFEPPSILHTADPHYNDDILAFTYETYVITNNKTTKESTILGGIEWTVTKVFDSETMEFNRVQISEPRVIEESTLQLSPIGPVIEKYKHALKASTEDEEDTGEAQWYEVGPRLPMGTPGYGNYCKHFT